MSSSGAIAASARWWPRRSGWSANSSASRRCACAPFLVRGPLDHHGLDHRVPERHLAGSVVDDDEVVALGRLELLEVPRPARCREDTQAAGAVEHREQEQASRRLGQAVDPGLVQGSDLAARSGGRGGVSAAGVVGSPIEAANSSSASGLPCASWATSRRTRVGRWANWCASSSIASDSTRAGDVELRQAGAFEEPAGSGSGRPEQSDPASRETPADEPDDRAGGAVEPVHVVDDDEQRGAGCRLAEQRQRCGQHREPVRCRAGPDAERHLDRARASGRGSCRRSSDSGSTS